MKFTVSQTALSEALSVSMKGVASASTLPILSGVLVKAGDGALEFQTTNLNTSVRDRVAARVDEPGAMVVSCKMLLNITKTLPDAPVTVEADGRQVHIECAKSSFKLNAMAVEDFPAFPDVTVDRHVDLPLSTLSDMVGRVYRVTSTDKNRPILTGVYMTVENNTIRLVATDSYRLAVCDTQVETSSLGEGSFELNVPSAAFNDALTVAAGQQSVTVGATDTQVVFSAGDITYVSRRIEGAFPNYKQLIPQSCTTSVKIPVAELNGALKRVAVVAQNNSAVRFQIDAEAGVLSLSAISSDQDAAQETLDVEATGESGTIAFNYHYIFSCLNALSGEDEITLELKSYMGAGVFKSYDAINYLYLVMPVRV